MIMEDEAIDWTYRPAELRNVRDAFAVFVTGASMEPKYRAGDIAYIHPEKSPIKGRYVLVETVCHTGLIKQFDGWKGSLLHLRQYNPAKQIIIPRHEVRNVFLVLGSMDG